MGIKSQGSIEQALHATAKQMFPPGAFDPLDGYGLVQVGAAVREALGIRSLAGDAPSGALQARMVSGNPARGEAAISYRVSTPGRVRARVFNARGELVRTLLDAVREAGFHTVVWDGRDQRGQEAPSGIYFMRIDAKDGAATRKVAFLR
jgi:hypothetical protein